MLRFVFDSADQSRDKEAAVLLHAFAYPKVLFGMIIGALMIGAGLRDWRGSPTRVLLLRLLEEQEAAGKVSEGRAEQVGAANSHPPTP